MKRGLFLVLLVIISLIQLQGCSSNSEIKSIAKSAIEETKNHFDCTRYWQYDPESIDKMKDFKFKIKKEELSPAEKANGVTVKWYVTVNFLMLYDYEWKDASTSMTIMKKNGEFLSPIKKERTALGKYLYTCPNINIH